MRVSTCSVADVSSGGRIDPALTQNAVIVASPQQDSLVKPIFPWCVDPHCGCAACMAKCDADAASGRIPLNGTWWFTQRAFVVEHGAGARVPGFCAEAAR